MCKYLQFTPALGDSNISTKVGRKYFILFTCLICHDSTGYSSDLPSSFKAALATIFKVTSTLKLPLAAAVGPSLPWAAQVLMQLLMLSLLYLHLHT